MNYYKQCGCKKFSDVVPCYDCVKAENRRLRDTLDERNKYCKWLEEENHRLRTVKIFPVLDKALTGGTTE